MVSKQDRPSDHARNEGCHELEDAPLPASAGQFFKPNATSGAYRNVLATRKKRPLPIGVCLKIGPSPKWLVSFWLIFQANQQASNQNRCAAFYRWHKALAHTALPLGRTQVGLGYVQPQRWLVMNHMKLAIGRAKNCLVHLSRTLVSVLYCQDPKRDSKWVPLGRKNAASVSEAQHHLGAIPFHSLSVPLRSNINPSLGNRDCGTSWNHRMCLPQWVKQWSAKRIRNKTRSLEERGVFVCSRDKGYPVKTYPLEDLLCSLTRSAGPPTTAQVDCPALFEIPTATFSRPPKGLWPWSLPESCHQSLRPKTDITNRPTATAPKNFTRLPPFASA